MDKRVRVETRPYPRQAVVVYYTAGYSEEAVDRMEATHNVERVLYESEDKTKRWWVVRKKKVEPTSAPVRAKRCKTCLQMVRKPY